MCYKPSCGLLGSLCRWCRVFLPVAKAARSGRQRNASDRLSSSIGGDCMGRLMKWTSGIISLIATRFRPVGRRNMSDPHNLQRFVDAQDPVFEEVCAELRDGHKESHWMW